MEYQGLLSIIERTPPRVLAYSVFFYSSVFALLRWITSTLFGLLVVVLVAYSYFALFGTSRPLTSVELLDWFIALEAGTQGGIVAGVFTIVGFFVAYRTSQLNWIEQRRIEQKLAISLEVGVFFDRTLELLVRLEFFARDLVKLHDIVSVEGATPRAEQLARRLSVDSDKFIQARSRARELSIEALFLATKYSSPLTGFSDVNDSVNLCTDALRTAVKNLRFSMPILDAREPNLAHRLIQGLDVDAVRRFCDGVDNWRNQIVVGTSHIRAVLEQDIREKTKVSDIGRNWRQLGPSVNTLAQMKKTLRDSKGRLTEAQK